MKFPSDYIFNFHNMRFNSFGAELFREMIYEICLHALHVRVYISMITRDDWSLLVVEIIFCLIILHVLLLVFFKIHLQ